MAMMWPFLAAALAVWYGILGRRPASFLLWVVTFGLFVASAMPYLPDALPFAL